MKKLQRRLKCPSFFDMNFSKKVLSLLSVSLEKYPYIFGRFKVSADNAIKIILDSDKDINLKDCINISREIERSLDVRLLISALKLHRLGGECIEITETIFKEHWQENSKFFSPMGQCYLEN